MSFKTGIVIATSILLAIAAFSSVKKNNTQLDEIQNPSVKDIFDQWTNLHGKNYATSEEQTYRMEVFLRNWLEVNRVNALNQGYTFALNQFSDMTREEFKAKYLGYRPSARIMNYEETPQTLTQAAGVDWRTKGFVNPVKDQGQCGSCWAFSAVAAMEGAWAQKTNKLENFSEQELVDCSHAYGNNGCNGGLMDRAFHFIKDHGITTSANYPYRAVDQKCDKAAEKKVVGKLNKWTDVKKNDTDSLKAAVNLRVVSVAIQADNIQSYSSGIFDNPNCGTQLDHGVSVVGYGTASGTDFWIVRNSWGSNWGEAGYIRMKIIPGSGPGECGINMAASYPVV